MSFINVIPDLFGSGGGGGGGSASWKDPVANSGALPPTGNSLGDARITQDTGNVYTWNGTSWINQSAALPLGSVTLINNTLTPTVALSFSTTTQSNVIISYSISRATFVENGEIRLSTDGTDAFFSQSGISSNGNNGVIFTADVSAGSLRLLYTTNNLGLDATFKYKVDNWDID